MHGKPPPRLGDCAARPCAETLFQTFPSHGRKMKVDSFWNVVDGNALALRATRRRVERLPAGVRSESVGYALLTEKSRQASPGARLSAVGHVSACDGRRETDRLGTSRVPIKAPRWVDHGRRDVSGRRDL